MIMIRKPGPELFNREYLKKRIKKRLVMLVIVQGVLNFLFYGLAAIPLNAAYIMFNDSDHLAKLNEQKVLLSAAPAWILFGPWNLLNHAYIKYSILKIQKQDSAPFPKYSDLDRK